MNKVKLIVAITLLISIFSLTACNNKPENFVQNDFIQPSGENQKNENIIPDNIEDNEETVDNGKILYFVSSEVVAEAENGIIKPIDRFTDKITFKEFLEQNYTSYSLEDNTSNKLEKIKLAVFDNEEISNINEDIIKELMKSGEKLGTNQMYLSDIEYDIYGINLPMNVSGEIFNMDANKAIGLNGYGCWLEIAPYGSFVTNAKFDIKFEEKSEDVALSDNVINAIEKYVDDNKISKDLKYTCTSAFDIDLNNDSKTEKVYVIETYHTNREEIFEYYNNNEVIETGAFSMMLIEKNDGTLESLLESSIKPFDDTPDASGNVNDFFVENVLGYIEQPDVYIADIDNDNYKEILVDAQGIELEGGKLMQFYDYIDGKYENVATSYYGFGN